MINALIGSLAATARGAGLAAQQMAARTGRRLGAMLIVALIAAAALIGALVFVAAAIHREIAVAASPTVADLVLAGIFFVVAIVTIAILASIGRVNRPPSHTRSGAMWQRPPAAGVAATNTAGPSRPPPQAPPMGNLFAGVDRSWILGAVAAAFVVGIGLGRRR